MAAKVTSAMSRFLRIGAARIRAATILPTTSQDGQVPALGDPA
jgi:hypothetical protein